MFTIMFYYPFCKNDTPLASYHFVFQISDLKQLQASDSFNLHTKITKSMWNFTIVISQCEGNFTSIISHLFVIHALLNTSLPLILQIGCQNHFRLDLAQTLQ